MAFFNSYRFKDIISGHFSVYKWYYISFAAAVVAGIVLGIINAAGNSGDTLLKLAARSNAVKYAEGEISDAGFFFSLFLANFLFSAAVFLSCMHVFALPAGFAAAIYKGYLTGFNFFILAATVQAGGLAGMIIIILPLELLQLACFIIIGAFCFYRCLYFKRYGHSCAGNYLWLLKRLALPLVLQLLLCVLQFFAYPFVFQSFVLVL